MRNITDHKLNGLNDALTVTALDGAGPGGANHEYEIRLVQPGNNATPDSVHCTPAMNVVKVALSFQNGPIGEAGINGISNEALLAVLIDRMRGFQFAPSTASDIAERFSKAPGPFACRENAIALTHLEEALMWMQKRTRDRLARGVEGTNKV